MVRRVGAKGALGLGAVAVVVAGVILAPWAIRNAQTFEKPVLISTNDGLTFMYANCDATYDTSSVFFASWAFYECTANHYKPARDPSAASDHMRAFAGNYALHHTAELPKVLAGRFAREWQLWAPIDGLKLERVEGRADSLSRMALASYYLLAILAVVGLAVLRKRRSYPVWPLVSMFVLVSVPAVVFYATFRFRMPAEVALVVLAALGIDGLLRRRWPVDDDLPPVLEPAPPTPVTAT